MLEEFVGQVVVVDLRSEYVCLGTLKRVCELFLELRNADLHDLRDTDTSRENYIAESRVSGIKSSQSSPAPDNAESRPACQQQSAAAPYWNATSAKLRSFRECSRSDSCCLSRSRAFRPISRCWPTRRR